ncbi:hypothetical protein LCGC14_1968760 [marine sediment metagenome]|uniref:Uncharacterized protein n=1 Tax=marine sediment metagenome TaxID=412755 RepID=A0A0F9HQU5_9ZZZZ
MVPELLASMPLWQDWLITVGVLAGLCLGAALLAAGVGGFR